ncbi:MAG: hypothetical protein ACREMT_03335, partial [Vulcanimicrobiaceae bacterium]
VVDYWAWSIGAVLFGAALVFSASLARFFHLSSSVPVIVAGATLALSVVVTAERAVLQGQHRFTAFSVSYIIDSIGRATLGPLGAIVLGTSGAIAGITASLIVTAAFNAVAIRRKMAAKPEQLRLPLRPFAKSALQIGATMLAINGMLFYDTILVRHFFAGEVAGLYSAAALVARAFYAGVGFIPIVLLPHATRRASRGEPSKHLLFGALAVVAIAAAFAVGVSVIDPSLLVRSIAGPAFSAAAPFVLPYVVALVALATANTIANYKIGLGHYEHALPLVAIAIAQITVVVLRHNSIHDVLMTILAGDACALAVTLYRVGAPAATILRAEPTA